MKKSIIIIILLFTVSAFSQEKVSFGLKAGISISSPTVDITQGYSSGNVDLKKGVSILFGGYIDLIKHNNIVISPELYYNSKITSVEYKSSYSKFTGDASVNYLSFGLQGKYFLGKTSPLPYLFVEPKLNFYLSDNIDNTNIKVPVEEQTYISDRYRKISFGLNAGAGLKFRFDDSVDMLIEALCAPDFGSLYDDNIYKVNNTSFEIKLGVGF